MSYDFDPDIDEDNEYLDSNEQELQYHTPMIMTPEAFLPLLQPARYKGAKGGRGSGKSHFFGETLVEECQLQHTRAVCGREIQNSIKDSSKQLIEDKITLFAHRYAGAQFANDDPTKVVYPGDPLIFDHFMSKWDIKEREIVYKPTESLVIFRGLQSHTAASIKSLEGFRIFWGDEAQAFSQRSLDLLTPTFRTPGAELWFSWNPENPDDPIDKLFDENSGDPDFILKVINYYDNPFFPVGLKKDMERDRRRDTDKYNHVWLGHHKNNSEARVFHNYTSEDFVTPRDATFLQGADWGFSVDPTVLVRGFIGRWSSEDKLNRFPVFDPEGDTLFIDHEAYQVGCEISDTPRLFDQLVTTDEEDPDWQIARRFQIRADSARPETISHMKKNGYPLIVPATKGPNSVKDGISFLQDYDIVVHTRCKHTKDELDHYKWKVDKMTNKVTHELEDKKNHVIDALRYMLELVRRKRKVQKFAAAEQIGVTESPSSVSERKGNLAFGAAESY